MARPALGQHYLVDRGILGRIVAAAELSPADTVVEVGPGRGVLTRELAERCQRVVAVEVDPFLADSLPARLGHPPNVEVVCADARSVPLGRWGPYKLVANLPYYAANPIVRRFLESEDRPLRMVVMLQREVARSMAAAPGKMTLLSVGAQFYGAPEIICTVPPRCFRPPPKVTSAVLRIDPFPAPRPEVEDVAGFFRTAKAGFAAPRKQMRNSLALGAGITGAQASEILQRAGIDGRRRPGSLAVEEWIRLHTAFGACAGGARAG